jgi:hypothetical protein
VALDFVTKISEELATSVLSVEVSREKKNEEVI